MPYSNETNVATPTLFLPLQVLGSAASPNVTPTQKSPAILSPDTVCSKNIEHKQKDGLLINSHVSIDYNINFVLNKSNF